MSLKIKTGTILAALLLLFGVIEYGIQQVIIIPGYERLEHREAVKNTKRVLQAVQREVHHLNLLCFDWAAWDDTYRFVTTPSEEYIRANLGVSTFTGNTINLIYILGPDRTPVWGRAYDLDTESRISVDVFHPDRLLSGPGFLDFDAGEKDLSKVFISGLINTDKGLMLMASRPIITSEFKGPVNGTLVMAKFFDSQLVDVIRSQTEVDFSVAFPTPSGSGELLDKIKISGGLYIDDDPGGALAVHTVIPDIHGNPAAIVHARYARDISRQGRQAADVALVSFIVSAFIILTAGLLLIQIFVLSPLARLNRHALDIAGSDQAFGTLLFHRNDEIGELSASVERMKNNLIKLKDDIQAIIDSMPFNLVCIDASGKIVRINTTAIQASAGRWKENTGQLLWEVMPELAPFEDRIIETVGTGRVDRLIRRIIKTGKSPLYVDITVYPLCYSDRNEAVLMVQDVTATVMM
ncbi:MAG TPA: hypothetical protein DHV36_19515, partial [Desulfobacteraceae bacterium]|nr:hypothetical protein [Desulfobacteraceae bacterium]